MLVSIGAVAATTTLATTTVKVGQWTYHRMQDEAAARSVRKEEKHAEKVLARQERALELGLRKKALVESAIQAGVSQDELQALEEELEMAAMASDLDELKRLLTKLGEVIETGTSSGVKLVQTTAEAARSVVSTRA